ncbi:MAG: hypothetical protein JST11_31940 [Acidobacteria bacterium]|nr:hypothetical protein [Acidobacteriota bacterium]
MSEPETIRQAVARGDYAAAREAWQRYAAALGAEIRAGVAGPERRRELEELYRWCLQVVTCARARAVDCLNGAHAASVYAAVPAVGRPLLRTSL